MQRRVKTSRLAETAADPAAAAARQPANTSWRPYIRFFTYLMVFNYIAGVLIYALSSVPSDADLATPASRLWYLAKLVWGGSLLYATVMSYAVRVPLAAVMFVQRGPDAAEAMLVFRWP